MSVKPKTLSLAKPLALLLSCRKIKQRWLAVALFNKMLYKGGRSCPTLSNVPQAAKIRVCWCERTQHDIMQHVVRLYIHQHGHGGHL